MVTIYQEGKQGMVGCVGRECAGNPVVDTVDAGWGAKAGLKAFRVFSEIVKQPCDPGDVGESEGVGELGGEFGNVAQMHREQLPFSRGFRQWIAIGIIGSMGIVAHGRNRQSGGA